MNEIQADTLIALADKAIEVRGAVGALRWGAYVQIEEVKRFTAMIKAVQVAGGDKVEMTSEVINAYNQMLWAAGLLAGIISKTGESDYTPDPGRTVN